MRPSKFSEGASSLDDLTLVSEKLQQKVMELEQKADAMHRQALYAYKQTITPIGSTTGTATNINPSLSQVTASYPQQIFPYLTASSGSSMIATPVASLPDMDKIELFDQMQDDGVLIVDNKLLFGAHSTKHLRDVPEEYLLNLNTAIKTLRRAMVREITRRRIVAKFKSHQGHTGD